MKKFEKEIIIIYEGEVEVEAWSSKKLKSDFKVKDFQLRYIDEDATF